MYNIPKLVMLTECSTMTEKQWDYLIEKYMEERMKIIFKKIKIENFKNIEFLETELWNKTFVYGANETGKTTFADAISYVLTGKNSSGESQFEFVPVSSNGLSPRVELEIEMTDKRGVKTVTLVRTYQAKQNKQKEFTGTYSTVCYVNGLKMGPKEFENWIEEHICNTEVFRLIHDVRYFTENISTNGRERPWETQRRLLFAICGIKPDIDMAKHKKRFNELCSGLQMYDSVNQFLDALNGLEKDCNKEIEFLNGKINSFSENLEPIKNNGITTCPLCGSEMKNNEEIKEFTPLTELKEKLKEQLEKRAQTCKMIDLCKDFIEIKCKLAQKKVNELFDGVQVEMFRKNKTNGELRECCDIFWNQVPYSSLSYSTKFVVSMKIALAFQKFYGISFPILVDNAESINLEQEFDLQMIFLIKKDSGCPNCGNSVGRKQADGMWTCPTCKNKFKKQLVIKVGE